MSKTKITKIISTVIISMVILFVLICALTPVFRKKLSAAEKEKIDSAVFCQTGGAERILCVDDNTDALRWRLRIIEQAQKDLTFVSYSYMDDDSGRDVMSALYNAAERGVKIRMVIDGLSGNMRGKEMFKALSVHDNIEIKIYNPINLLIPHRLNYRMHDKYIIADDSVYILGGRNTKNVSLGAYQDDYDIDRDIVVFNEKPENGGSVSQLKSYFEEIWSLSTTKKFEKEPKNILNIKNRIHSEYEDLLKSYPEVFEKTDWYAVTVPARSVNLLHNSAYAWNKEPALWSVLQKLMTEGHDIWVQTPYLICGQEMYKDLYKLCNESRHMSIITNSPVSGANIFGCADYLNQKRNISRIGADIYEYKGAHSSHTKTVLIDDNISVVGSFNFDMRSAYIDTELMLVIDCPELNSHLREMCSDYRKESIHIEPDGKKIPGESYEAASISFPKNILYLLLRLITIPIRHLL